ncbi:MAG: Gfo/Idh/MocA family oxidoreductase, partial [Phycisphaerales bacterium]|nr:Gfo/Idh/MocA family oxidoreductase [Phycisphaerales bacterium]
MKDKTTRRQFLGEATSLTAGGLTASMLVGGRAMGSVHVHGNETIQVALVGSGGRGTGAAYQSLAVPRGQTRLVAMADVFKDRLDNSVRALKNAFEDRFDVPEERQFLGFDAYRHAMDCLRPGDVVILTTPPAFRWVHFKYAIERGLHVFMEKPLCVDGPTSRRMLELADLSEQKNLKVGVGLMSRHAAPMLELHERVRNGELGEIIAQRGYRMQGAVGTFRSLPVPEGMNELEYQIRRFHSFLWTSGGCFNDFNIHIIDHLAWMKGAWPVKAQATGGRHWRFREDGVPYVDQNFDSYAVEYTYPDGTKMEFKGRTIDGCREQYASYMHGTKGAAVVSNNGDCGEPSRIYRNHEFRRSNVVWQSTDLTEENGNPYQNEWNVLIDAIIAD